MATTLTPRQIALQMIDISRVQEECINCIGAAHGQGDHAEAKRQQSRYDDFECQLRHYRLALKAAQEMVT